MKTFLIIIGIIFSIALLSIIGFVCNNASRFVSNGVETAHKEFDPAALLAKYEWFKAASAGLDEKIANINTFKSTLQADSMYGKNASKWPRDVRENHALTVSYLTGTINSYNELAAQYNAAMVEFNYKFCNVGDLPKGADIPLPREYKPYINSL